MRSFAQTSLGSGFAATRSFAQTSVVRLRCYEKLCSNVCSAAVPPDVRRGYASPATQKNRMGCAPGSGSARTRGVAPILLYSYGEAEPRLTSGGTAASASARATTLRAKPRRPQQLAHGVKVRRKGMPEKFRTIARPSTIDSKLIQSGPSGSPMPNFPSARGTSACTPST